AAGRARPVLPRRARAGGPASHLQLRLLRVALVPLLRARGGSAVCGGGAPRALRGRAAEPSGPARVLLRSLPWSAPLLAVLDLGCSRLRRLVALRSGAPRLRLRRNRGGRLRRDSVRLRAVGRGLLPGEPVPRSPDLLRRPRRSLRAEVQGL